MNAIRFAVVAALISFTSPVLAANTQAMTDAYKEAALAGGVQVPASGCIGNGNPSSCCTAADTGASCPVFKLALVTSSGTYNASSTTFSGTNEVSGGNYTAGGNTLTAPTAEADYIQTTTNDACVHFTSPTTWASATITANAGILYCDSGCIPDNLIIGVYCLDGSTCAANTSSTGGTFTVTLPTTVGAAVYCITN